MTSTSTTRRRPPRHVGALAALALAVGLATPAVAQTATLESVAHRGDKQHHPDNSVAGIDSAVAKGADWIEIDVLYNPDGDTFFLSHDNGCSGPGGSATIDSSPYATVVANCALPELDDVLARSARQGYGAFIVELKATSRTVTTAPARLVATVEAAGLVDQAWISSLSDPALVRARDTGTDLRLMRVRNWSGPFRVGEGWLRETATLGFDAANVNIGAWSAQRIRFAGSLGLVTSGWAFPTTDEGDNTQAIELGLDLFMTDRLDDLHRKIGRG